MAGKPGGKRKQSPRIKRKREQSRQEILQTADAVLARHGLDGVTLAAVAGELGLTKQALYHYFPSKEALVRSLVVVQLDEEIKALIEAVESERSDARVLGAMIRAFYAHYIDRLNAFRAVYCQSQMYHDPSLILDETVIREDINPRTRSLFDVIESRLGKNMTRGASRARIRQLAFSAWLGALGLMSMLSIADAANDPLIHSDKDLVDTLAKTFDAAVG